ARAFAHATVRVERDALGISVHLRFHVNELRIHVVCGGFGHARQRVGRHAIPRADADVDPVFDGFGAQVASPFPARDVHFSRDGQPADADIAVAAQRDWTDVTRI